jgi:RNA polymerase sigma factor (sigma-70 family)
VAAVPSIGRAVRVEGAPAPEADLTRALYEQYANQIFRYCVHQLGSREEAEDAVQSTFLNAFRGIKRGVVPELESAWLFKIAHNVCLSRRRTSWRRGRIESPTDFGVVEDLTPAPSRRADELIGLQDALEQMPESQRRAILLREWQGLSYREIAEELELSQAAVETLIFRARRALATGLEQPPERTRRIVRGADVGNALAGLKSLLLGGGAAVKVAATVAVVSASTVVAAAPVQQHRARVHAAPKPAAQALASHASAAPSRPAARVAGPAAAFPAKAGVHAPARPRLQLAAVAFVQIAGSATPDSATVEAPPEPAAIPAEHGPAPAAPVPEQPAAPPAVPPNDTGHAEPQHAPAASASTTAPTDKTTPASITRAGRGSSSEGGSAQQGATSGVEGSGDSKGQSHSSGQIDSKGSDSEQRTRSSAVGGTTAAPVVSDSATAAAPVQAIQPTTTQPIATQATAGRSSSNESSGPARSSTWSDARKGDSDKKATVSTAPAPAPVGAPAPVPVVAPPATVTPPGLSSADASLPGAAPAGVESGETPTARGNGKGRDRGKGDGH